MKLIKINESQKERLFEAYQEGFSFENLSLIADNAFANGTEDSQLQMRYCTHWLGYPFAMGSSRAVYTLNDNLVLKLAYGRKYEAGIAQNRVEANIYSQLDTPLLPRILYHDKNFTFLVSENAVPCEAVDFEKIVGIPFFSTYMQQSYQGKDNQSKYNGDYEIGYDKYFDNLKSKAETVDMTVYEIISYLQRRYSDIEVIIDPEIENVINNNPWLTELRNLIEKTQMLDLGQVGNFGIVNRDGKPTIVILDSGFNFNIYINYYQNRY